MSFMYVSNLDVEFGDGSRGMVRYEGVTMTAAQNKAMKKVKELIDTGKSDNDEALQVVSFKTSTYKETYKEEI